eukprot:5416374-Amphidinium_carterae.1
MTSQSRGCVSQGRTALHMLSSRPITDNENSGAHKLASRPLDPRSDFTPTSIQSLSGSLPGFRGVGE